MLKNLCLGFARYYLLFILLLLPELALVVLSTLKIGKISR